jgi:tRNA-specific 2-thiouridylase
VIVGLSGGVDSAVAALLLRDEGYVVRAATLELWPGDDERSCCSPQAVARARDAAHVLGLAHFTLDERALFAERVVGPFMRAYEEGETPNPCVGCNEERFVRLLRLANRLGEGYVATGHYARVVTADGRPYAGEGEAFLARGRDRTKDQSYMLWRVPPEVLTRLLLPLGALEKSEVRARAARAGLPVAGQAESQEVCFAPDDYRRLLAARGVRARAGAIVDRDGRVLGRHDGQWRYTIGQRRGLGLSGPEPLYVLERRAATNEVVVGRRAALDASEVELRGLSDRGLAPVAGRLAGRPLAVGEELGPRAGLEVQLRYRAGAVGVARLTRGDTDRVRLTLAAPFAGPAPGQSAVFYRQGVVVGGGVITATVNETAG